ncbi:Serine/threonine-protein kinase Nek5 [Chytridiales sp. JEL 0842]|nr:Serine/threonine-protein kinase Nek5 [Chytridiales sp. JEL 0842]
MQRSNHYLRTPLKLPHELNTAGGVNARSEQLAKPRPNPLLSQPRNKYVYGQTIGRGSSCTVKLIKRRDSKGWMCVKIIPIRDRHHEQQEHILLSSISTHPNIIKFIEYFEYNESLHIVTEWCAGGDLYAHIRQSKKLIGATLASRRASPSDELNLWEMFIQVLDGLAHLHKHGILHRDVKSKNIFLDKDLKILKLGDLGIARRLGRDELAWTAIGTPNYFSPELCKGKSYTWSSDIWAAGCVLYEMAAKTYPFEANSLQDLMIQIKTKQPTSKSVEGYSHNFHQMVSMMLDKDPERRPKLDWLRYQVKSFIQDLHNQASFASGVKAQVHANGAFKSLPRQQHPSTSKSVARPPSSLSSSTASSAKPRIDTHRDKRKAGHSQIKVVLSAPSVTGSSASSKSSLQRSKRVAPAGRAVNQPATAPQAKVVRPILGDAPNKSAKPTQFLQPPRTAASDQEQSAAPQQKSGAINTQRKKSQDTTPPLTGAHVSPFYRIEELRYALEKNLGLDIFLSLYNTETSKTPAERKRAKDSQQIQQSKSSRRRESAQDIVALLVEMERKHYSL